MRRLENTNFNELKELRVRNDIIFESAVFKSETMCRVWFNMQWHSVRYLMVRPFKDSTSALEEKYKKAMVQNAQLDNEKTTIHYEVIE